jgi:hypothetical protein
MYQSKLPMHHSKGAVAKSMYSCNSIMKYGYLFISTKEISNSLHMHQLPDIDLWTLNPDILFSESTIF